MDRSLHDTLTEWRRHLHANPELTLHEKETSAFVQAKLSEMGVPFVAGVGGWWHRSVDQHEKVTLLPAALAALGSRALDLAVRDADRIPHA